MNFLEKQRITYRHEFGFQKEKSTEYAILDIYASIINAIETNDKTCCIFLEFAKAKAFDSVNHNIFILIRVLRGIGVLEGIVSKLENESYIH